MKRFAMMVMVLMMIAMVLCGCNASKGENRKIAVTFKSRKTRMKIKIERTCFKSVFESLKQIMLMTSMAARTRVS